MPDEKLERLGKYFVGFNIREKHDLTFEQFINLVDSGLWGKMLLLRKTYKEMF